MNFEKLTITDLKPDDFEVMLNAVQSYMHALKTHLEVDERSQQYIHISILNELKYDLLKRVNTRGKTAKKAQYTIELHTAFLLFDALSFFSNQCDDHLNSARLNRVMIAVHSELPRTRDGKNLSIMSSLNFDEN